MNTENLTPVERAIFNSSKSFNLQMGYSDSVAETKAYERIGRCYEIVEQEAADRLIDISRGVYD